MKRMARMMLMNNKPDRRDDRDRPRERPQEMGYAGYPPYPIYGGDRENGYGGPEDRFSPGLEQKRLNFADSRSVPGQQKPSILRLDQVHLPSRG